MRYRSSYKGLQQRSARSGGNKFSKQMHVWLLIGGLVVLFAGSMFLFRTAKHEKPKPTTGVIAVDNAPTSTPSVLDKPDATLIGLVTGKPVGTATRTLANGVVHVSANVSLPGIDRVSQFYQVWLVRSIPYDYVSVGEMITNDLGTFVLDWNSPSDQDYSGYTKVVITLQARGGDTDPQTHIVEGEFGK